MVPVLGSISCGVPKLADAHVKEYVKFPAKLFGDGDLYFMPAHGDAMTGAGIKEGDLLVVERKDEAEYKQIVIVEITGAAPFAANNGYILHERQRSMAQILLERFCGFY